MTTRKSTKSKSGEAQFTVNLDFLIKNHELQLEETRAYQMLAQAIAYGLSNDESNILRFWDFIQMINKTHSLTCTKTDFDILKKCVKESKLATIVKAQLFMAFDEAKEK